MLQVKSDPQVGDSVRRGLPMTYVSYMAEGGVDIDIYLYMYTQHVFL